MASDGTGAGRLRAVSAREFLELATRAAREAGAALRERFAGPRTGVGTKSSSTDMVSDADRTAEDLILALIDEARPNDAVLGEESGSRAGTSGVRWIIDPLDGTTNFLYGIPHFSVSIGCEDGDGLLAAVVYDVAREEIFQATRGGGSFCNGESVAVSQQTDLAKALIATGFSYDAGNRRAQSMLLEHILPRVRDIRRSGSAALDLAWTAAGRFDCFFEAGLAPWDRAAGELIVKEAGGWFGLIEDVLPGEAAVVCAPYGLSDMLRALIEDARSQARAASR